MSFRIFCLLLFLFLTQLHYASLPPCTRIPNKDLYHSMPCAHYSALWYWDEITHAEIQFIGKFFGHLSNAGMHRIFSSMLKSDPIFYLSPSTHVHKHHYLPSSANCIASICELRPLSSFSILDYLLFFDFLKIILD